MQKKWDPILAAAKRLFIDQGYGATSMDAVAAASGATKRTVYNNFGSKEQLLEAVIDEAIEHFGQAVPGLPEELNAEAATGYAAQVIAMMTWRDAVGLQRFAVSDGCNFPDLVARLVTATREAVTGPVRQHLEARGCPAAKAADAADGFIERATATARLDRLVGLRPPYGEPDEGIVLDDKDLQAAAEAARWLINQTQEAARP